MSGAEKVLAWMEQPYLSLRMRVYNTFAVGGVTLFVAVIASCALGSYWWAVAGLAWLLLCYAHAFGILVSLQRMRPDDKTFFDLTAPTEEELKA